ncbi:hypothetical protein AB0O34_27340, partial [Sphaerisporangium sp. NPDC088356]|uniref:hypothetical protein n=1 Tax=Sphaerisporangium sp. NPDC088356 TaxID=3154871 RepID=UPI00342CBFDB
SPLAARRSPLAARRSPLAARRTSLTVERWTREDVTALFLTPATAGLSGGETRTVPEGTITNLDVCVPLDPMNTPTVAIDKRYATAKQEIGVPYKGHLTQQGWVLPTNADAAHVMKQVRRNLPRCRYPGSMNAPMDPRTRISGTSRSAKYARDSFGWHGHRIEQTMNRNGERASVSTLLLLQRGPVLLALDYTNYTPKVPEQKLHSYNLGVPRKIRAHPAGRG